MADALSNEPGDIIGYRKDGRPIRLMAGGAPEDEGTEGDGPAAPTGTSRFYTQEQFDAERERVRQEERDKLYPTISKSDERSKAMADELKELRAFQKKQEKVEADRLAAIEAERKKAAEAEMTAKDLIERRQAEFETRMAQIEADNSARVALVEKELEFTRLQAYIQRRINEESDTIAPELLDFIDGNTPEAVEASIERVKAKTAQILENVRGANVRQRAAMPGVSPSAGTNGVTPLDTPGNRELSAAEINAMGMGEYAELRKRAGIGGANNQGLFRV